MAIDMIENNELGALASSRVGLQQFTDENKVYKNFTGESDFFKNNDANEEFANLFGSKTFKDNKAKATKEAEDFFKKLPATTCLDIQKALEKATLYIENQTKELSLLKGHVVEYPKNRIAVARKYENAYKQKQADLNCIEVIAKAEEEAKKTELLQTLTSVSEASVQQAKTDLFGLPIGAPVYGNVPTQNTTSSLLGSNKNLLIYGGIAIGAILLITMLRKQD